MLEYYKVEGEIRHRIGRRTWVVLKEKKKRGGGVSDVSVFVLKYFYNLDLGHWVTSVGFVRQNAA